MKTMTAVLVLCLVVFVACGEPEEYRSSIGVVEEAPGVECAAGGFVVTVENEKYYSCHGESGSHGKDGIDGVDGVDGTSPVITTVQVVAGAVDNPCEGPALRVTVTSADGEDVQVEYICHAFDPVGGFLSEIHASISAMRDEESALRCECMASSMGYPSIGECVDGEKITYAEKQFAMLCIDEAYYKYGRPAPQDFKGYMACVVELYGAMEACLKASDKALVCMTDPRGICENELQPMAAECQGNSISVESDAWWEDFHEFAELSGCPDFRI